MFKSPTSINQPFMKKDYEYYSGISQNLWNRSQFKCQKQIGINQKQVSRAQKYVDDINKQMQTQNVFQQGKKMFSTVKKRLDLQQNYEQKKIKRQILQINSNQQLDSNDQMEDLQNTLDQIGIDSQKSLIQENNKYSFQVPNRGKNIWNDFNKLNKKHTDQIITKRVLKQDEQGFKNIMEKIQQQKEEEELNQQYLKFFQNTVRESFQSRRQQNQHVHQSLGISIKKSKKKLTKIETERPEIFQRLTKQTDKNQFQKFQTQCIDFQGLLIGDLDNDKMKKVDVPYVKKLKDSQVLQTKLDVMENEKSQRLSYFIEKSQELSQSNIQFRFSNQQKTPTKLDNQYDTFNQKNLNDLDEYDRKFHHTKFNGFPNRELGQKSQSYRIKL